MDLRQMPAEYLLADSGNEVDSQILLVEDEVDTVVELGDWLDLKKIRFLATTDPHLALNIVLHHETINTVIVDAHMAQMSGYALITSINSHLPQHRQLRFIIIPGHPSGSDYESAEKLGVTAFLEKPVDLDTLERLLRANMIA